MLNLYTQQQHNNNNTTTTTVNIILYQLTENQLKVGFVSYYFKKRSFFLYPFIDRNRKYSYTPLPHTPTANIILYQLTENT